MDTEITPARRLRDAVLRALPAVVIAGFVLLLLSWAIGLLRPGVQQARLRTGIVTRADLEAVITASGVVQPASDSVISSPVDARVLRVVRQPGSRLDVGDPILELDVGRAALEVSRLEGTREQRRNERRELELGLEQQLIELRSQLEVRRLDIEELRYQTEQDRRLYDEGLISEAELRATLVRERKAEIEERKVEDQIENTRASVAARLASLDAQLATLERELAEARQKAAMAITRADRPGLLTWVLSEAGAAVRPGEVLARIADPDRFRVEATIADVHAPRLHEGQAVTVPIGDSELSGSVARILPAVEEGALRFWVELDDPSHALLRANQRADVLVVVERLAGVLTVPKGPSTSSSGPQRLFVLEGERAVRRDVVLGLSGYRAYEVREGLAEGEVVILSDMTRYLDMEEVDVRD